MLADSFYPCLTPLWGWECFDYCSCTLTEVTLQCVYWITCLYRLWWGHIYSVQLLNVFMCVSIQLHFWLYGALCFPVLFIYFSFWGSKADVWKLERELKPGIYILCRTRIYSWMQISKVCLSWFEVEQYITVLSTTKFSHSIRKINKYSLSLSPSFLPPFLSPINKVSSRFI